VNLEGKVIAAIQPDELKVLKRDPRLAIEIRETVQGYNVDKGRAEKLLLVVMRPRRAVRGRPAPHGRPA